VEKIMTIVTVQLTPDIEQRLRLQASKRGETLETFLRQLAEKEANSDSDAPEMLSQGLEWLTRRSAEDVRAARERIFGVAPPVREIPAGKTVLDLVEGKWPGTETDAEIHEALAKIS
jgi:hypothetical protein